MTRRCRCLAELVVLTALVAAPAFAQGLASATDPLDTSIASERTSERPMRLRLFLDDTILSPTLVAGIAFSAALDQRDAAPTAWGVGASGYGKRAAARAGLVLSQTGVHHATAAMLGLDPRGDRSRCGCGHPLKRAGHALLRTFATRDSRGRAVPNVPLFVGAAGGALIARTWYPHADGPGRDAARLAAVTVLGHAGSNVFREFAPDLKRLFAGDRR